MHLAAVSRATTHHLRLVVFLSFILVVFFCLYFLRPTVASSAATLKKCTHAFFIITFLARSCFVAAKNISIASWSHHMSTYTTVCCWAPKMSTSFCLLFMAKHFCSQFFFLLSHSSREPVRCEMCLPPSPLS